jgi:ribosomal protein L22
LCIFIALFIVFVFLLNRIDIANSIAIFSSVFLADVIIKLVGKGKYFKKIGLVLLSFLLFMASVNILNGFKDIYLATYASKKNLRVHHRIYQDINRTIGHYTENAIVFHPFVKNQYWIWGGDLVHLNIPMYQEEFVKTKLAREYSDRSWNDFSEYLGYETNKIRAVTVNSEAEAVKHVINNLKIDKMIDYIYVDKGLNVKRLQFKY